ncbi:MAG: permease prefix domain 1-containing protein [Bacteroidia bacterium]
MESTTKRTEFHLETALTAWEKEFLLAGTFTQEDVLELSSHLRMEIEALKMKDLSEEEAFLIASNRLGNSTQLAPEFSKVNQTFFVKKEMVLLLLGALLFFVIEAVFSALSKGSCIVLMKTRYLDWFSTYSISAAKVSFCFHYIVFFAFLFVVVALFQKANTLTSFFLEKLQKSPKWLMTIVGSLIFGVGCLKDRVNLSFYYATMVKKELYHNSQLWEVVTYYSIGTFLVLLIFSLLILSQYQHKRAANLQTALSFANWKVLLLICFAISLMFHTSFMAQNIYIGFIFSIIASAVNAWVVSHQKKYPFFAKLLIANAFYFFVLSFVFLEEELESQLLMLTILVCTFMVSFGVLKWPERKVIIPSEYV